MMNTLGQLVRDISGIFGQPIPFLILIGIMVVLIIAMLSSRSRRASLDRFYGTKGGNQGITVMQPGIRVDGDVVGQHNLMVLGEIKGNINLDALLVIGETGKVGGEVHAKNIVVEGEMDGNIRADERVELKNTAKYTGHITSPSLKISENCYFKGTVDMEEGVPIQDKIKPEQS
ncbi:polymer-forming cytoskeletal protein [candidate division KSB1 bacterium]|nr:polymer-forming cytoskeletal protein [candidate division KSB1 bacterium]